jgi:hypothetical protein
MHRLFRPPDAELHGGDHRSMSSMAAASRAGDLAGWMSPTTVTRPGDLFASGCTQSRLRAQLAAQRWQRFGRVVLLHNSEPSRHELFEIARLNTSPRAAFTGFTACELAGLTGWRRETVQLLVPDGVRVRSLPWVTVRVHRGTVEASYRNREPLAPALLRAAGSLSAPRPACGLLAAGVQQRLVRATDLSRAIEGLPRIRHGRVLRLAIADIGQGAQALSEIDFVRLCRRHRMPLPRLQAIRPDRFGRRRCLDAEWDLPDGRRLAVEIDGAIHLMATRWWLDQLRQNEFVLTGSVFLRFPSVIVRTEEALVVDQLWRAFST